MNGDHLAGLRQLSDTIPDRKVSFVSAINEAIDFGEPAPIHDPLKLLAPVGTHHQDNLINLVTLFETVDRMSNDRLVADEAQQFIKSHPLAAASRYNNGGDHEESCQCQSVVSVSCQCQCQWGAGALAFHFSPI